jgi:TadE-like protein
MICNRAAEQAPDALVAFGRWVAISIKNLRRSDRGGALVEFAITLPLLALLAIAAADYGRVYRTSIEVANAARAGAQFGGHTYGDEAAMIAAARADAAPLVLDVVTAGRYCTCPDGTTPVCSSGNCGAYGAPQAFDTVRVAEVVPLIFHYPGLPTSISVTRTVVFRAQ